MKDLTNRLAQLIQQGVAYVNAAADQQLSQKPSPTKWSKKEIVGHLIDSAINNLQRFTEIQYWDKPYTIRKYNQDELIRANRYQDEDVSELLGLWTALNNRIIRVMAVQTKETLAYTLVLPDGQPADLRFLMQDYVDHLEHHLRQILR